MYDGRQTPRDTLLHETDSSFPKVQPLPGGEVLLVSSRCRGFEVGTVENNTRVYDATGRLVREFCLGDGIEEVHAGRDGAIWVSYFDEGVYRNFGWGAPHGAVPIGSAGLACFDSNGVVRWTNSPPPNVGPIDDCYALNVAGDATWAYYYSEFRLVRIEPSGDITAFSTEVSGANAFVVWKDQGLLFGGYGDERLRCSLWRFGAGDLTNPIEFRLMLPAGETFEAGAVVGRGPALHVFVGPAWHQTDLRTCKPD